jgi:Protein of unknown function (DUF3592).
MTEQTTFFIGFLLMGLIFTAIGIYGILKINNQKQSCKVHTAGTLIPVRIDSKENDENTVYMYTPELMYSAEGVIYTQLSKSTQSQLKEDTNVTIFYATNEQERYYIAQNRMNIKNNYILACGGILLVIIGILIPLFT